MTNPARPAAALGMMLLSCAPDSADEAWEARAEQDGALRVCAQGETVDGIDVAHHEGDIDWAAVAATDVKFAFVRVSYGTGTRDTKLEKNWTGAKEAGLLRGAYQYFRPKQDAEAQARLFLDMLSYDPIGEGDLPPVLDVEAVDGVSNAALREGMRTWLEIVELETGKRPIIYTAAFMQDRVGSGFGDYPLWVANYTKKCPLLPTGWDAWTFWQHSESGTVDGVTDDLVDLDRFNGTLDELRALAGQASPPPDPDPQDPVDPPKGPPPKNATFHLNYKPTKDWARCADRDIVVFDMFDTPKADFDKCKGMGAKMLCYFSSQYEDWRPDSGDFGALGPALDGWPGETWVDPSDPANLEVMKKRVALAVERGCDGVDIDNVDRDGHESYVISIFDEARARGLWVSQKNAIEKIPLFFDHVDLYQNEQCQEYDECGAYESVGRPVYNIEYTACRTLPYLYSNRKDMQAMDAWEGACTL